MNKNIIIIKRERLLPYSIVELINILVPHYKEYKKQGLKSLPKKNYLSIERCSVSKTSASFFFVLFNEKLNFPSLRTTTKTITSASSTTKVIAKKHTLSICTFLLSSMYCTNS